MSTITQSGPIPPEGGEPVTPGASAGSGVPAGPGAAASLPVVPVVPAPPLPRESVLHVPRDTTPTWELEMLVSGAVLYGLFQLPPLVDSAWRVVSVRFGSEFAQLVSRFGFLYVMASIYALTLTFVVHLASRAYWVALVGVDSVFPGGIRWDRARSYGPITSELIRRRVPPLSRGISRLDNFCSVAFAVGFAAVSAVLFLLVMLLGACALVWGGSQLFFGGRGLTYIFLFAVVVLILPMFALIVDRRVGERLRPDGWAARAIRSLARLNPRLAGLGLLGSLSLTLTTNLGGRRIRWITFGLLMISFLIAYAQLTQSRRGAPLTVLPGLPSSLEHQAGSYRHYADQRAGGDLYATVPFIQSDVVQGPYVRLFIPYVPERDEYELSACRRVRMGQSAGSAKPASGPAGVTAPPEASPGPVANAMGEDELAVLCLSGIYDVTVDGRRMPIDYRFYKDAASGLQGLLGYIPTAGLPRGGNVLTVRRPRPGADTPPPVPYAIRFWL